VKIHLMVIAGAVMAVSGLTQCMAADPAPVAPATPAAPAESKVAAPQTVCVCPHCHTMAMKAGKCTMCGKDLVEKHMLGMKDGKVLVCDCPAGCKCDAAGMKDGKCACGKAVQEVSPKGMYVCACPGGKCCSAVSDKPGKCGCGTEMKKVE
jgi:hypothetical protein